MTDSKSTREAMPRTEEERELISLIRSATPEDAAWLFRCAIVLIAMNERQERDAGGREAKRLFDCLQAKLVNHSIARAGIDEYIAAMENAMRLA